MRYLELFEQTQIPPTLAALAKAIRGRSFESAKRAVVSKVGSVNRNERFPDDVADAVFLRLQRNAQVGGYTSEEGLNKLGRKAERLTGPGMITLYRAAPRGAGIRPGDFAASTAYEAGFYTHGGNVIQSAKVPRADVISLIGSSGGDQEYVYLPKGYQPPEPVEHFSSFRAFYDAVNHAV